MSTQPWFCSRPALCLHTHHPAPGAVVGRALTLGWDLWLQHSVSPMRPWGLSFPLFLSFLHPLRFQKWFLLPVPSSHVYGSLWLRAFLGELAIKILGAYFIRHSTAHTAMHILFTSGLKLRLVWAVNHSILEDRQEKKVGKYVREEGMSWSTHKHLKISQYSPWKPIHKLCSEHHQNIFQKW